MPFCLFLQNLICLRLCILYLLLQFMHPGGATKALYLYINVTIRTCFNIHKTVGYKFEVESVLLPVYQVCVLLFELGFKVTVGQTVTFQLWDFLLQITDLKSDRPSLSFSKNKRQTDNALTGATAESEIGLCTFSVMSRSQESMLSVNRSSVLLPWLDPNTLWLAWNSCLKGQRDQKRAQRASGKRKCRLPPKATSSAFITKLQATPLVKYRDGRAAAFRLIKVKVRSLTAQTLCWKSFCLGWNKTQTSVGHSAITAFHSKSPNDLNIKQQLVDDYLDIHACKVFLPLQYKKNKKMVLSCSPSHVQWHTNFTGSKSI